MRVLLLLLALSQPAFAEIDQAIDQAADFDFTPPFLGTTPAHHQADAIMLISLGTVWTGGGILALGSATVATVALGGGTLLMTAVIVVMLGGQADTAAVPLSAGLLATMFAGVFQYGLAAALIAAGAAALVVGRNLYVRAGAMTAEGAPTASASEREPSVNVGPPPLSAREQALLERAREVLTEKGYKAKLSSDGRRVWTAQEVEQLEGGTYRHNIDVAPSGIDGIRVTADCEMAEGEGEAQRWKPCPRDDPMWGRLTEKAQKVGREARKRGNE